MWKLGLTNVCVGFCLLQVSDMFKRERSWAEQDRREHRVGNWRGFVKDGKRRKEVDAPGWKEERRVSVHGCRTLAICCWSHIFSCVFQQDDKKFGVVDNDEYKKNWK